jgi:UDP-N-acetylmuramoyl-L-alanyl-D-glutamate--2,6-diaminopimelate ligase
VVAYGRDVVAKGIKVGDLVSRFKLVRGSNGVYINLPLPGEYNVSNSLAAASCAMELFGISLEDIKRALESFDSKDLIGRFDRVEDITGLNVVVDFAHTPNALHKVLNYAARVKPVGSKLIVVFGAAGERDSLKRPQMGEVAAKTADFVVLTAEDPRSESPEKIIDDIAKGCFAQGAVEGKNFARVPDRRRAIRLALQKAKKGDVVLVLGKGHERTMAVAGVEHPWNDHQAVKEEFARLKDDWTS